MYSRKNRENKTNDIILKIGYINIERLLIFSLGILWG